MARVGIIGAMDEEIEFIKNDVEVNGTRKVAGTDFYICKYGSVEFILVRSGIGKVNAAVCTQILIDVFGVEAIINTGVAGAADPGLDVGDVVISDDLVEHDMDVSALGDPVGQVPRMDVFSFKSDEKLISLAESAGKKVGQGRTIKVGRIVSGDQFISGEEKILYLRQKFGALAVEMEGAAIGHTCYINKIPFVVIRCISDRADKSASVDFAKFAHSASKVSSDMVMDMLSNM